MSIGSSCFSKEQSGRLITIPLSIIFSSKDSFFFPPSFTDNNTYNSVLLSCRETENENFRSNCTRNLLPRFCCTSGKSARSVMKSSRLALNTPSNLMVLALDLESRLRASFAEWNGTPSVPALAKPCFKSRRRFINLRPRRFHQRFLFE